MKLHIYQFIFLCSMLLFAFSIKSNAQIVYTDVIPDTTIGSVYHLDLNNDGINDFDITSSANIAIGNCGPPPTNLAKSVTPLNLNEVGTAWTPYGTSSSPSALQQNTSIDSSSLIWKTNSNQILAAKNWHCAINGGWPHWVPNSGGSWLGVTNKYLSLKLQVGAQTFYGWVRLDVNSYVTSLIVKDYAYNSTPDQQIFAGDTCVFPVSINISGNDSICSGDVVALSVSGGNTYLWSTGSTSQNVSVNPTLSTIYSVTVIDSMAGCTAILNQLIHVTSLNATVNQTADTLWCSQYVGGGDTFQWIDCTTQQIIPGATSNIYVPIFSGSYAVIYSIFGCSDTSACFSFSGVGISVNGSSSICTGDSTTLFVSFGASYLWSTGETTLNITVSPLVTTNYSVILSDSAFNIITTLNQQIIVTSVSASLIQSNDSLIAVGGDSISTYHWIDCNTNLQIAGANSNIFIPTTGGTYAAIIYKNGCSDTSNCITMVSTGVHEYETLEHISVYPNPATNSVSIKFSSNETGEIQIANSFGQVVFSEKINSEEETIDVSKFSDGMYVVRWSMGKINETKSFSIIK